jgi:hypothetical protein
MTWREVDTVLYATRVTTPSTYSCPVCGLDGLQEPGDAEFASFEICPCCGTEFGYDDDQGACGKDLAPEVPGDHAYSNPEYRLAAHLALRGRWVTSGMKWWSTASEPPAGWDPVLQLSQLNKKESR